MTSYTAEETIAKARECYELGMIDEGQLEHITKMAATEVDYNPVLDLPFPWDIAHERRLRRKAKLKRESHVLQRLIRRMRG